MDIKNRQAEEEENKQMKAKQREKVQSKILFTLTFCVAFASSKHS